MNCFYFFIFRPISTNVLFTTPRKIAIVSVTNDLATDQRVQRTCSVLEECGYKVIFVGRRLKHSRSVEHIPYSTKRFRLLFTSGPLFYLFFNLRLFFFLLFRKSTLLFANDLDTLLPNFLISRFKNIPLIYDSHEIFCEVPELKDSPLKKRIWEKMESLIVPKIKHCVTVNKSIGDHFEKKYGTHFSVVRNIPSIHFTNDPRSKKELNLPEEKKILIYQGSGINIQRGAEELVQAMQFVENAHLYIIGGGDVFPLLKKMRLELNLEAKITIIDKIQKQELYNYTANSDLGISIDKDTNLNYHFSLPNKLFDYIQAGIPVLVTRLPEIEHLVKEYEIGNFIENHEPHHIAQRITETLFSPKYPAMKQNTTRAANENTWENEKKGLISLINTLNS